LQESLDFLDDSGELEFSDSESQAFLQSLVDKDWATIDRYIYYGYVVTKESFYSIALERPSSDRLEFLANRLPLVERMEWMREIREYYTGNPADYSFYKTDMLIFAALLNTTPTADLGAEDFMKDGFRNLYMNAVEQYEVKAMKAFYEGAGGLDLKRAFFEVNFPSLDVLKEKYSSRMSAMIPGAKKMSPGEIRRRLQWRERDLRHMQCAHVTAVIHQLIQHGADPNLRIPREEADRQKWAFNPEELWKNVSWDIEMPRTVCALEGASSLKFELLVLNAAHTMNLNEKEMEYYLFSQILAERKFASAPGNLPCSDFLTKVSFGRFPYPWEKFLTFDRLERTLFRMDDAISEVEHFVSALLGCGTAEAMWRVSDRFLNWEAVVPNELSSLVNDRSKDYPKWFSDEDWLVRAHVLLEEEYNWGNKARSSIVECFQTDDCQGELLALCILDFCNLYTMNEALRNVLDSPRNRILGAYCFEGEMDRGFYKRFDMKTSTAPVSRWILKGRNLRYTKDMMKCIRSSHYSKNHIGFCAIENLHQLFNSAERNTGRELLNERVATIRRKVRAFASDASLPIDSTSLDECACILCQPRLYFDY